MEFIGFPPIGVFGFIVLIVLIGSLFSFLKVRSNNETIRQLAQSGQPIDPSLLERLGRDSEDGRGGLLIGGFITLAVAVGLYFFGAQIGLATDDPEVGPIFRGIAMIPGAIGAALMIAGFLQLMFRRRSDRDR